jgi:hypothetical protein
LDKATVFSCRQEIVFATPLAEAAAETRLRRFLAEIGGQLAFGGIILGHIKLAAKIPGGDNFLFLSMTRADEVDARHSAKGGLDGGLLAGVELTLNALVVGRGRQEIGEIVSIAMGKLCQEE